MFAYLMQDASVATTFEEIRTVARMFAVWLVTGHNFAEGHLFSNTYICFIMFYIRDVLSEVTACLSSILNSKDKYLRSLIYLLLFRQTKVPHLDLSYNIPYNSKFFFMFFKE